MGLEFAGADGDIPLSLYRPEKIEQLKGMGKQHMKAGHDEKMGSTLGLTVKEASRPSLFAKKVCLLSSSSLTQIEKRQRC